MRPMYLDDQGEYFELDWLELPAELLSDVFAWNEDYQWIVPLSMEERASGAVRKAIAELDERGLALSSRLCAALGIDEVEYFSEGYLREIRDREHLRQVHLGEE